MTKAVGLLRQSQLPAPPSPQHGKEKGNELDYVLAMLLRDMALHLLFEFNLRLYGGCAMTDKLLTDREVLVMEIFAAMFNPCTHESSFEVLGLYLSMESAQREVDKQKRKETKAYKGELPSWVQFKVEVMKVKP